MLNLVDVFAGVAAIRDSPVQATIIFQDYPLRWPARLRHPWAGARTLPALRTLRGPDLKGWTPRDW